MRRAKCQSPARAGNGATYSRMRPRSYERLIEERRRQFGKWMQDRREQLGYKLYEAAKRGGISRQQWIRLEAGDSGIGIETVPKIAKALKADLNETFRRAGYQPFDADPSLPAYVNQMNELPLPLREAVMIQIEALWLKHKNPKANQ